MTATVDDSSPEARDQVLPRLCAVGEGVMRGRDAERQVVRGLLRRAQRVVDEGGSNTIDTFVVGRNGAPGLAITTPSVGGEPGHSAVHSQPAPPRDPRLTAGSSATG
jgi:hypothetical protein